MSAVIAQPETPALEYRPLLERDLVTVAAIEANVYAFPWTLGNFRDSLGSGYECTGCWAGRELIGYAIMMTALEEAHLLNFAVAGNWQRRGVGAGFLQHLIDGLRRQRLEMLYLEVRPSNIVARRMYERFGFRQLGLRREYYPAVAGREDALFLGMNLAPKIL
ncbi:MAG: ribosomal protein S18-alanine N-acetyltransferase [Betaproteobacteria bacterium]